MKVLCVSSNLGYVRQFLSHFASDSVTLGFIPTAGNVYDDSPWVAMDRQRLANLGYQVKEIDISRHTREESLAAIDSVHALYVAGGNTFYLLQELQRKNLVGELRTRIMAGLPYIGASAGAAILTEDIEYVSPFDSTDLAPELNGFAGLGVLRFYPLLHYGNPLTLAARNQVLATRPELELVPLRDDRVLCTEDGQSYTISPSTPE